jgi:hypothetical protein
VRLIPTADVPPEIEPFTTVPGGDELLITPAALRPESFDPTRQGWELVPDEARPPATVGLTAADMTFTPLEFVRARICTVVTLSAAYK